ncbi:MAG: hypothetical protein INH41_25630 [Myxococcaceae bacterium]|jgi:hypothetical protein|nr:hypothetical protein [Myxococcaceae bacterium]MCA3015782.1 hypothetical protein [Myxococcaceae bacterium]
MVATLLALTLACRPPPPVPVLTTRCEGPDLVSRDHDAMERARHRGACLAVRCEGADLVRRDGAGREHGRASFSMRCLTMACEGGDLVRRTLDGAEVSRTAFAPRCAPPPVRVVQRDDWRFGLVAR